MAAGAAAPEARTYEQELQYIDKQSPVEYIVKIGMVPNMRVPGMFYLNDRLKTLLFDELHAATERGGSGGFQPAVKQIANVAALPGIVKVRALSINVLILLHAELRRLLICTWACAQQLRTVRVGEQYVSPAIQSASSL